MRSGSTSAARPATSEAGGSSCSCLSTPTPLRAFMTSCSMACETAGLQLHRVLPSHSRTSVSSRPYIVPTVSAACGDDSSSSASRRTTSSTSSRSGPNFSSAVLVAATTKHGHGVTHSPTRLHSPLSTRGLVVNFSHMKAAACPSASACRAPCKLPTTSYCRLAGSTPRDRASTAAIRWLPLPMRLTAKRAPPSALCSASTLWQNELWCTCTPQVSGVRT
mmetsp:Transcript_73513/g.177390  ORF Transcript_73513/g.177390 Transcript_73513/m.177390 type:complete len:220 (+) Transcript_73513:163-822(+)